MIQATVHLNQDNQIVGQFYHNSSPIGKIQYFTNREQAENYMARSFNRTVSQVQSCWVGTGYKQVLYLTRLEPKDG